MVAGFLRRDVRKVKRGKARRKAVAMSQSLRIPVERADALVKQLWPRKR